jgi:two-component system, response regulator YesN
MRPDAILIVEDDEAVQELFTLVLGDTYDVKHAMTAGQALAILRGEPVDLMLLDYRLPDRTGLELLQDLRSSEPRLPVIMVTGYGSEWVCTSAFRLGITDYLAKPVNIFELRESVRRAIAPPPGIGTALAEPAPIEEHQEETHEVPRQLDLAIQKALELIRQRYWDSLSLSGLAREVGMSKYRLSHRFSQVMGVSLRKYLLKIRLERAKDLLAHGRASITEVAQAVGFGDLPRFDKLFRRYTGLTPSAFRSRSAPPATKADNGH